MEIYIYIITKIYNIGIETFLYSNLKPRLFSFFSFQKQPYADPTHIAQSTNPWSHLYRTCTLSSSRREVYHMDPKAPRDSLDFVLKATYDHHKEYLKGKNETLVQQETLGYNHGYDWTHYVYILYKLIKYIIVDFNPFTTEARFYVLNAKAFST